MESYQRHENAGRPGFVTIVNGGTGNQGAMRDYRRFRYTLGSTLLGNGQTSFDYGDQAHEQLWYYDEYDASLGTPAGPPNNLSEFRQSGQFAAGLWRRDFTRGVVVLNATTVAQSVHFDDPLDHLLGSQDASVNSGAPVTDVTLAPNDGVVLLKPIADLVNVVFRVGSFVHVFDSSGAAKRRGFFPNAQTSRGGTLQWVGDLDRDGRSDAIRADATALTVTLGTGERHVLLPYGSRYHAGVTFAVGDLNGDGRQEIVTGPLSGGPQIQIFDFRGRHLGGFFARLIKNGNGVRVAVGDLDGSGRAQILATAARRPSTVQVYTSAGVFERAWAGPAEPASASGYTLAVGDLDGQGNIDALVGSGSGAPPQLAIFSGRGALKRAFAPLAPGNRSGFLTSVVDIDGDGKKEILVMAERVL